MKEVEYTILGDHFNLYTNRDNVHVFHIVITDDYITRDISMNMVTDMKYLFMIKTEPYYILGVDVDDINNVHEQLKGKCTILAEYD